MPPRKPNVSLTTATNDEATPVKERDGINIEVGRKFLQSMCNRLTGTTFLPPRSSMPLQCAHPIADQDLSLPKTMVQRLAKGVLPPNTQIHKDAILAMQKGATVFINHLAFQ